MDNSIEVIVPTFINAHLFWIIPKKDILLRSAISRVIKNSKCKRIKNLDEVSDIELVAVNIDKYWARATIKDITKTDNGVQYICWLPDYAVMRSVNNLFHLPGDLEKCPSLSKQASLDKVVNLMTDLVLGDSGYEFQFKTTTDDIEGVKKIALDCIETAKNIFFSVKHEDIFSLYGDIICEYQENTRESLTEYLMDKKLVRIDEDLFNTIDPSRDHFKEKHFNYSLNWQKDIDKAQEEKLSSIIFNKNKNVAMGFFDRKIIHDSNRSAF